MAVDALLLLLFEKPGDVLIQIAVKAGRNEIRQKEADGRKAEV